MRYNINELRQEFASYYSFSKQGTQHQLRFLGTVYRHAKKAALEKILRRKLIQEKLAAG